MKTFASPPIVMALFVALSFSSGCESNGGGLSSYGTADGTVGEWAELGPMPHARANHCAVVIGDEIVVVGGNYIPAGGTTFVSSDEVHAARVREDGTLEAWRVAGHTPSAVSSCTAVADGKRLLLAGGLWDDPADEETVWVADLALGGALSEWTPAGALPSGTVILSSEGYVAGGELVLLDTEIQTEGDATLALRAPLGSLGSWTREEFEGRFRGYPAFAFDGTHLFAAGGYLGADQGNAVVADVRVSSLGDAASAFDATGMPEPLAFGRAVALDGHLFVVGGKDAIFGSGSQAVYSAVIDASGALSGWAAQTELPRGRTNFAAVVAKGHLFVLGGGENGPGLDTVYAARIQR